MRSDSEQSNTGISDVVLKKEQISEGNTLKQNRVVVHFDKADIPVHW